MESTATAAPQAGQLPAIILSAGAPAFTVPADEGDGAGPGIWGEG